MIRYPSRGSSRLSAVEPAGGTAYVSDLRGLEETKVKGRIIAYELFTLGFWALMCLVAAYYLNLDFIAHSNLEANSSDSLVSAYGGIVVMFCVLYNLALGLVLVPAELFSIKKYLGGFGVQYTSDPVVRAMVMRTLLIVIAANTWILVVAAIVWF